MSPSPTRARLGALVVGLLVLVAAPGPAARGQGEAAPVTSSGRREVRGFAGTLRVGTFEAEVQVASSTRDGLPSDDVRALAITGDGAVWAGTAAGLARLAPGARTWEVIAGVGSSAVTALARADDRAAWVVTGQTLTLVDDSGQVSRRVGLKEGSISLDVRSLAGGDAPLLATSSGLFTLAASAERVERVVTRFDRGLTRVIRRLGVTFVGSEHGLRVHGRDFARAMLPDDGRGSWERVPVRDMCFDGRGRLWFASPRGAGRFEPDTGVWRLFTGADGLPREDATCVAAAPDDPEGHVWIGTRKGAVRTDGEVFEYRQGRRWLPHDDVRAIAVDRRGQPWIATARGVACIERRPMTLDEKAAFFNQEIERRHLRTRLGYVESVLLQDPDDPDAGWTHHDSDNDGLWTSMYGAAQCFEYAATRDPAARARARRSFEALRFLSQVTQGGSHPAPPGFPARTVVPTTEPDPNARHGPGRDAQVQRVRDRLWKVMDLRWPTSADGRWYWKCDTSSDELDGHFFFYAQYHDLVCETDAERAEVAAVVGTLLGHLEVHGWRLVDWDGRPTRWANFAPESLNRDPAWVEERGLNSLSLLSYLAVGAHVTGDPRWRRHARDLVERHGYAMNVLQGVKPHMGPGTGNQSDDEMAFMCFYDLLLYEDDPALRAVYARAFASAWEVEAPERNPLFAFLHAAVNTGARASTPWGDLDLSPGGSWLEDAVDSLRRLPLDRRRWAHANADRADVVPVVDGHGDGAPRGRLRDGRALPVDERSFTHWNHDPWRLDGEHDGSELADGAVFLLPWALGRYHGFAE